MYMIARLIPHSCCLRWTLIVHVHFEHICIRDLTSVYMWKLCIYMYVYYIISLDHAIMADYLLMSQLGQHTPIMENSQIRTRHCSFKCIQHCVFKCTWHQCTHSEPTIGPDKYFFFFLPIIHFFSANKHAL